MGGSEMIIFPAYQRGTVAEEIWRRHHDGKTIEEIAEEQRLGRTFVHDVIVMAWAREREGER